MTDTRHDPLLLAAQGFVYAIIGIMGIAATVLTIAIPFILLNRSMVIREIVESHPEAVGSSLIGPIIVLLLVVITLLALAIVFLFNLRRIILSVGEGDPFIPVNARRLARMGWITVIMQFAAFPATALAGWVQQSIDDLNVDFEFSLTGLLLALILFILARVFRQGAAMREDLEGTV